MQPIRIDDFDDPRLADYANLKDARLAADRGRFIVEGRGSLGVLVERSPHRPESILLSERTWGSMQPEFERWTIDSPVYVGNQALLDRVVGFPIHRGCLASCRRTQLPEARGLAADLLEKEAAPRLLVLEGITNLDNVGGLFRNAMALGAAGILLCPRSCDPLYRKAIRTSMGGSLCVPFARAERWPELLDQLVELGYEILALDPGADSEPLEQIDAQAIGPAALVLGTEGPGLSDEALARADRLLRIGMEPGVDSLNVSVAGAIALHRLRPA